MMGLGVMGEIDESKPGPVCSQNRSPGPASCEGYTLFEWWKEAYDFTAQTQKMLLSLERHLTWFPVDTLADGFYAHGTISFPTKRGGVEVGPFDSPPMGSD